MPIWKYIHTFVCNHLAELMWFHPVWGPETSSRQSLLSELKSCFLCGDLAVVTWPREPWWEHFPGQCGVISEWKSLQIHLWSTAGVSPRAAFCLREETPHWKWRNGSRKLIGPRVLQVEQSASRWTGARGRSGPQDSRWRPVWSTCCRFRPWTGKVGKAPEPQSPSSLVTDHHSSWTPPINWMFLKAPAWASRESDLHTHFTLIYVLACLSETSFKFYWLKNLCVCVYVCAPS